MLEISGAIHDVAIIVLISSERFLSMYSEAKKIQKDIFKAESFEVYIFIMWAVDGDFI